MQWYILNRDGSVVEEAHLPERPQEARAVQGGEVFTPWYKEDEHVHVENNEIQRIHARGTLESVRALLVRALKSESELLRKFGGEEDMLLKDALSVLNKK